MQALAPPSRTDFILLHALAERDTLAAGAKIAGMSRSAAIRRISLLERRYGIALVDGDDDAVRLTEIGWSLMAAGRRLLRALDGVLLTVTDDPEPHVAALPMLRMASFGTDWAGLADDLVAQVPGLLLDVVPGEPEQCLGLFTERAVDAAYVWLATGSPQGFGRPATVDVVVDEPLWVALPDDHPRAADAEVGLADLADDGWLVGAAAEAAMLLNRACQGVLEPRIGFVAESPAQLRSLLAQRQGIALVSPLSVPPGERSGFVMRPLREAPARRQVLVTDPTVVRPRLARALLGSLRRSYVATAQARNPDYARSARFPLPVELPVSTTAARPQPDRELLGGLVVTPSRPTKPRAGCRLEPEDLHLLRVVSECGSLNRAAPILLITQPALTRRIGRLEQRLGLCLLVRGHRGTALTPIARRLLDRLAEPEAAVRAALTGAPGRGHRPAQQELAAG
jgi:DNA-binding transcriptional LysR family regulator